MPGIGVILENLPIHQQSRVVVEVDTESDIVPLPESDRIEINWLFRNGQEPGNKNQLVNAIQALEIPDIPGYAWGGGEIRTMNAIGKYLRRTVGFRPTDVCAVGYWYAGSH